MWIASLACIVLMQAPTTSLTGVVVGTKGEPIVGAELILVDTPRMGNWKTVARGKTGEGGRFSLDRPVEMVGEATEQAWQMAPILWVVKPGFRLSVTRFPGELPKADQPLRIALEPPGKAVVVVERPDGRPAAGIKIYAERLKTPSIDIPMDVAELIATTSGPDGRVVFDAVAQEDLAYIEARSPEFGIQGRIHTPRGAEPAILALRAFSTFKGRLAAEAPESLKGWKVRGWTNLGFTWMEAPLTVGYVTTTVDDDGRFTLGPIAVGDLLLQLDPPDGLSVMADVPRGFVVAEGKENSAEIRLLKPTIVTGKIIERGTGKPVPGYKVTLIDQGTRKHRSEDAMTDADGRYTLKSLPGLVTLVYAWPPRTHVQIPSQTNAMPRFDVPADVAKFELPTREVLAAGPPVRGVVRDEACRPIAGATVEADCTYTFEKQTWGGARHTSISDASGNFVLDGLHPGSKLFITARLLERKNPQPVEIQLADAQAPITITIAPRPVFALSGRLVGPSGAPLAGVPVKFHYRTPREIQAGFSLPLQLDGNPEIRTGPDGVFRTPKELDHSPNEFRAEVLIEGFRPARTDWVAAPAGELLTFPDLAPKRTRVPRSVTGRVVDRDGKPVEDAAISHLDSPGRMPTKTDADGRFRLHDVAGVAATLFVEAKGFRAGGAIVGDGDAPVEIRLSREGEPPVANLKALPSPMSRAEERALAREILEPLLSMARSGSLGNSNAAVIPALARVNPTRVLDMIENRAISGSTPALIQAALGQYEDDPAAAVATIGADSDPAARAAGWLSLEGFRPAPVRARREELLDRALADARRVEGFSAKLKLLGEVADRFLALGAIEKARPILNEGKELLAKPPRGRVTFEDAKFGEVLVATDLPGGLETIGKPRAGMAKAAEGVRQGDLQSRSRAAVSIAAVDPGEAEKLLTPPPVNLEIRRRAVLEVARRMARADLPRARRLLLTMEDPSRRLQNRPATAPFGLGLLADELAETDPAGARALLDEAYAGLRRVAAEGRDQAGVESAANLMAELLPAVERIDPDRCAERAWLAASVRKATSQEPRAPEIEGVLALAMAISRYDRPLGAVIADPILEILPDLFTLTVEPYGNAAATIAKALAAYDPRAVAPLLRALPNSARQERKMNDSTRIVSLETLIRLGAAEVLGVPPGAGRAKEAGRVGDLASPYRLDR